jgi:AcrR family transcriptional regulator
VSESRREVRRRQLLDAALEVFAEKGYPNATVEDIVERVQVARGTFYLYFEDKRSVFQALLDEFLERISGAIQGIVLDDPKRPPREQLRGNLDRIIRLALDAPGIVKLTLVEARGLDPEVDEKLELFLNALRRFMDESLAEGQDAGIVHVGDRPIFVSLALGAFRELVVDAVDGPRDRPPEAPLAGAMTSLEGWPLTPAMQDQEPA